MVADQYDDKIKQISIKLMELGNLILVAVSFGKAIAPDIIDVEWFGFGLGLAIWLYMIAWFIRPNQRR